MNTDTLLIVGGCGLALLCLVILGAAALFLFRVTTRGVVPILASLRDQISEQGAEDNEKPIVHQPRPDLRAIAQQHDFNAALAQQVIEQQIEPPPPPPITAQNAAYIPPDQTAPPQTPHFHTPPPTLEPREPDPRFGSRRRPNELRKRDREDEEFGGMLGAGDEGDSDI